jgi:hypothetical protein
LREVIILRFSERNVSRKESISLFVGQKVKRSLGMGDIWRKKGDPLFVKGI